MAQADARIPLIFLLKLFIAAREVRARQRKRKRKREILFRKFAQVLASFVFLRDAFRCIAFERERALTTTVSYLMQARRMQAQDNPEGGLKSLKAF